MKTAAPAKHVPTADTGHHRGCPEHNLYSGVSVEIGGAKNPGPWHAPFCPACEAVWKASPQFRAGALEALREAALAAPQGPGTPWWLRRPQGAS